MTKWRPTISRLGGLGLLMPLQTLSKDVSITLSNNETLCQQYQKFTTANGLYTCMNAPLAFWRGGALIKIASSVHEPVGSRWLGFSMHDSEEDYPVRTLLALVHQH